MTWRSPSRHEPQKVRDILKKTLGSFRKECVLQRRTHTSREKDMYTPDSVAGTATEGGELSTSGFRYKGSSRRRLSQRHGFFLSGSSDARASLEEIKISEISLSSYIYRSRPHEFRRDVTQWARSAPIGSDVTGASLAANRHASRLAYACMLPQRVLHYFKIKDHFWLQYLTEKRFPP